LKIFGREFFKPRTPRTRSPDENLPPLRSGRISQSPTTKYLSPYRSRQTALLKRLRATYGAVDAIELLTEETGDLSQALYNFVRLANVGHEMKIFALDKTTRLSDIELEWRDFASRVNAMSNAGLDGLIDQFHYLAFVRGAMTCEVEVAQTLDDIVEVYPVNPQTITWQLEERNGRQVWIPYQVPTDFISRTTLANGLVSLEDANFFWAPTDPKVDDPRGRLLLKPALASIDFQIQILNDVQAVLHNQGFPRYDISIVLERLMALMPPDVKSDSSKIRTWIKDHINFIKGLYEELEPDDSFIHTDDVVVDMSKGAANQGRGIDVRAVMEMVDVQIENSVKTPGTMMQRVNSNTETWATVQFRVFVSGLQSIQRGSKRLIESICKLWLRVHGYQAIPVFEHNTIDYTSELQRSQIKQAKAVFLQLAQNMGWVDGNEAANELFGHDAVGDPRSTQPQNQGGDQNQNNGDQSQNNE